MPALRVQITQVLAKEAGKDKMEKYAEQVDRALTRRTSGLKEREKEKETILANSVHSIISGDMDKTSAVIDAMVSTARSLRSCGGERRGGFNYLT